MANNITTSPRLWSLDTVGELKAAGNKVVVEGIHFEPAAVANICSIGEYAPDGSTVQQVIRVRGGAAVADPIDVEFAEPLELNGLYLSTITAGTAYLRIRSVTPK
jgi:hypothetical protein